MCWWAMMNSKNTFFCLAIVAVLGVRAAVGGNFATLAEQCRSRDERACAKVQKRIRKCRDTSECGVNLKILPSPFLLRLKDDPKLTPSIKGAIESLLRDRAAQDTRDQAAKVAQEARDRAANAARAAGFPKLKAGMTLWEVEATIGPIESGMSVDTGLPSFLTPQHLAQQFREVVSDTSLSCRIGRTVEVYSFGHVSSQLFTGKDDNPQRSIFVWKGLDFSLTFGCGGKLLRWSPPWPD
jgi:hypothetical protein